MPNWRRETRGLRTNQVKAFNEAWHHARRIGRPLNVLISLCPLDIDSMSPEARCELFDAFRNKLGVYTRGRGFPPTFIWSREVHPNGTGEHIHVLMHVPTKHRHHFDATVIGWYPGPGEVDVTTASQKTQFSSNGRRMSAVGYISKQMTPQAWYKRGLIRKAGGPILGKRGGTTRNLDWRAREDFRQSWNSSPHVVSSGARRAETFRQAHPKGSEGP